MVTAGQPVVSSATTLTGGVTVQPQDPRLRFRGAGDFTVGTTSPDNVLLLPTSKWPHTYGAQSSWGVEFHTDAPVFEFVWKYTAAIAMFRLTVDGVRGELQPCRGITLGSRHVTRIDLGQQCPRHVAIDFYSMPFGGLFLPPAGSLWPVVTGQPRWIAFGDSIAGGSSPQNDGMGQGTWVSHLAAQFGYDGWNQGIGGTGYISAGQGVKHADRFQADVADYHPDRITVFGAYNDRGLDQTALRAAADTLHTMVAAVGVPATVIGCWSPKGVPDANVVATDNTVRASAAACGLPFVSPVTGAVYDASGALIATHGPWITAGNQALYVGNDATHPTNLGHVHIAARLRAAQELLGW